MLCGLLTWLHKRFAFIISDKFTKKYIKTYEYGVAIFVSSVYNQSTMECIGT